MVDIGVISASDEVSEGIEWALRSAGWRTARAAPSDFKRGRISFVDFLNEFDPVVLVWEVAVPFEENWAYFQTIRHDPAVVDRRFVLITNNGRALRKVIAPPDRKAPLLEFLATPTHLDELCTSIRRAWRAA